MENRGGGRRVTIHALARIFTSAVEAAVVALLAGVVHRVVMRRAEVQTLVVPKIFE